MKFKYCPSCSSELGTVIDSGKAYAGCEQEGCGYIHFNNPRTVAVALVPKFNSDTRELELLLMTRGNENDDGYRKKALPGGNVDEYESPEMAVVRELREETGLEGRVTRILDTKNPVPGKTNFILTYFEVKVDDYSTMRETSEASDLEFRALKGFPKLAFPDHERVAKEYLSDPDNGYRTKTI